MGRNASVRPTSPDIRGYPRAFTMAAVRVRIWLFRAETADLRPSRASRLTRERSLVRNQPRPSLPRDTALWHVARSRDKRQVCWSAFDTEAEALEAAGLSE